MAMNTDGEATPMVVTDNLTQSQDMMLLSATKDGGYTSGDFGED